MADIAYGESIEEQLAVLMRVVNDLRRDVYGNGSPGLKDKAERFMSEADGARKEQQMEQERNARKLNWLLAICALATVMIGVMGLLVTVETIHRSELDPAKIFHSFSGGEEYSQFRGARMELSQQ